MKSCKSTAYHEVGHAVVAASLGIPVLSISFTKRKLRHWGGHVITDENAVVTDSQATQIALAGPVCECNFLAWAFIEEHRKHDDFQIGPFEKMKFEELDFSTFFSAVSNRTVDGFDFPIGFDLKPIGKILPVQPVLSINTEGWSKDFSQLGLVTIEDIQAVRSILSSQSSKIDSISRECISIIERRSTDPACVDIDGSQVPVRVVSELFATARTVTSLSISRVQAAIPAMVAE